ncbi:hypothetical protein ACLB1G_12575 [Oxalobacteraceae bacterium A2-2]
MKPISLTMPKNCPPAYALPCHGTVFRACRNSPPQEYDFRTFAEQGRARGKSGLMLCMCFGLSVFGAKSDCLHMLSLFPSNGSYIAEGLLSAQHGVIANTPGRFSLHQTWWPFDGIVRSAAFH